MIGEERRQAVERLVFLPFRDRQTLDGQDFVHGHEALAIARGPDARRDLVAVAEEKLFPLQTLISMSYPPSDQVQTFYNESEKLVCFLALTDKKSFLSFLDALGRHQPFETALFQNYGTKFLTPEALEEKFRDYAANEMGTSLQPAGGG